MAAKVKVRVLKETLKKDFQLQESLDLMELFYEEKKMKNDWLLGDYRIKSGSELVLKLYYMLIYFDGIFESNGSWKRIQLNQFMPNSTIKDVKKKHFFRIIIVRLHYFVF